MEETRDPQTGNGKWREWLFVVTLTIAIVVPLVIWIVNLTCDDDPSSGVPESHRPEIVRVQNADIVSLPSLAVPRLDLSGEYEIRKGEFLTTDPGTNAPEGFLLKAVSPSNTSADNGTVETTVRTRPASIYEAEPAGQLVANPSDFENPRERLLPRASLTPQTPKAEPVTAVLRTGVAEDGLIWPYLSSQVKVKCEGKTKLPDLTPEFKPHFKPHFDLRWNDAKRWKRRIETADAGIEATLTAGVSGTVSAEFKCTLTPQRGIPIFAIVVPVGAVPVPIRVEATGALTASATAATSAIDKDDPLRIEVKGSTGIEYDRDRVTTRPPHLESIEATIRAPKSNVQGTLGFRAKPGLAIEAGWRIPALGKAAAVAEMRIGTGVDLIYDEDAESQLEACIPLELEGGFHFHLPGKEWGKESKPYNLRKPECRPINLSHRRQG
jgi:hypothetical protein